VKLPHLDQVLELQRGEARQLLEHLTTLGERMAFVLSPEGHGSLKPHELLALPALNRVTGRVRRLALSAAAQVGKASGRPRRFRLSYDELIALRLCVPVTGLDAVLGKVQQKSLNLAPYVNF
jgi:hypothetical protein